MAKNKNIPSYYLLNGSDKDDNLKHRIDFLTNLFNTAHNKGDYIGELRQKNLNYSLIIFAALVTFGQQYSVEKYSLISSIALVCTTLIFCLLDYRYHLFIHGWRKTRKEMFNALCGIINKPTMDVNIKRYYAEGEMEVKKEIFHLQPLINYLLVLGAIMNLVYHLFLK